MGHNEGSPPVDVSCITTDKSDRFRSRSPGGATGRPPSACTVLTLDVVALVRTAVLCSRRCAGFTLLAAASRRCWVAKFAVATVGLLFAVAWLTTRSVNGSSGRLPQNQNTPMTLKQDGDDDFHSVSA